jgi:hypothetical protein
MTAPSRTDAAATRFGVVVGARVRVLQRHGDTIELTGKPALLLAMAALEGPLERRRTALLLWPDSPETQARNNTCAPRCIGSTSAAAPSC